MSKWDCASLEPLPGVPRVRILDEDGRELFEGYPLHACMQCPTKALAVAPDDGGDCRHFERGDRKKHYKEV